MPVPADTTASALPKSQLSGAEWNTLIESLYVRRDDPPYVTLAIGIPLPSTVELDGVAERISLTQAALDVRFTGDPAGNQFRHAFEALPRDRYDVDHARALIQLNASPVHPDDRARHYVRWADDYPDVVLDCLRRDVLVSAETLRQLSKTVLGTSSAFVMQLCDRIGRGGPDEELLGVFKDVQFSTATSDYEVPMLDALLRLHEGGYRDCEVNLRVLFASVDFGRVKAHRPDLVYRAGTVANELGLLD
jgi:hypothetical protein